METYIALLRGINVGGRNTLAMRELKDLLSEFDQVSTYIQSGNVVLCAKAQDPAQLAERIGHTIAASKGFRPQVFVLHRSQLEAAIHAAPFPVDKTLHFFFLAAAPAVGSVDQLALTAAPSESLRLIGRVLYVLAPQGIGRSKLVSSVERVLGVAATARNGNTVNTLLTMAQNRAAPP